MTRTQRGRAVQASQVRAALERFVENPVRLSTSRTEALLNELCAQLGWCLAPDDFDRIVANPPTDPQAFAELVVELDGGGVDDPALFFPVLELVLKTFEGIARGEADD